MSCSICAFAAIGTMREVSKAGLTNWTWIGQCSGERFPARVVSQCTGSAHEVGNASNGQNVRSRFKNVVNAMPERKFCNHTHALRG
ncbi:Uncharacterised protein [Mycobacteroides abscessus]|nr:Uncharacterised protein [Mycobacteroides abscessus]